MNTSLWLFLWVQVSGKKLGCENTGPICDKSVLNLLGFIFFFLIVKLPSNNNKVLNFSPLGLYIPYMLAGGPDQINIKYLCLCLEMTITRVCLLRMMAEMPLLNKNGRTIT